MTDVTIDLRQPAADGTLGAPAGAVMFVPTARHVDLTSVVLPIAFSVQLVNGQAVVTLEPTTTAWVWQVNERVPGGVIRNVQVPTSATPIAYTDLVDIDPATLVPVGPPPADVWAAALDAATAGATTTATMAATTATTQAVEATSASSAAASAASAAATSEASAATSASTAQSLVGAASTAVQPAALAAALTPKLDVTVAAATYALPGVPANVLALTRDASHNANAATVLRPWYAALANRRSHRANIVVIGDSITNGTGATTILTRYVARLAEEMRLRFPVAGVTGGRGYIPAANTGANFVWPASGGSVMDTGYGPNRTITQIVAGAPCTYTLIGTSADIVYVTYSGWGHLGVSVDGGTVTDINLVGDGVTRDGVTTRIPLGAAGAHTLVVSDVSGTGNFDGVIEYNGDENAGITVHDCGHAGWDTSLWATGGTDPVAGWPAAIAALQPDVILIVLGVNDLQLGTPPATTQADITSIIASVRAALPAAPTPPVVIVPLYAIGGASATWPPYVDALYAAAAADSAAVVADLSLRMPPGDSATVYGTFWDSIHVHPNDKGHAMIADAMAAFLSPS